MFAMLKLFFDNLRFEGADDKGGGGEKPSETPPPAKPPVTPPATPPAAESGEDKEPAKEPGWLKPRLDEAHKAGANALIKELGFEKPDELKAALAAFKAEQEAKLSESEKLQNKLKETEDQRAALEKQLQEQRDAAIVKDVNDAIKEAAQALHALHPEDVVTHLRQGDLSKLVDDKGKVKVDAIKPLLDQVVKDRPTWFAVAAPGIRSNRGGKTAVGNTEELKKLNGGKPLVRL